MANGEVNCTIGQLESKGATAFLAEHGDDFVANCVWCSVDGCNASARYSQNGTIMSNGECKEDGTRHGSRTIGPRPVPRTFPGQITIKDTRTRAEAAQAIADKEQYTESRLVQVKSLLDRVAWGVGTTVIALSVRLRQ